MRIGDLEGSKGSKASKNKEENKDIGEKKREKNDIMLRNNPS